jgi:hypothetical protein
MTEKRGRRNKMRPPLEQLNFETLPPALDGETSLLSSSVSCCAATAETSFAYACGAGGGTRRQGISTFSMLKCPCERQNNR